MLLEWVIEAFGALLTTVLDLTLGMVPDPPGWAVTGSANMTEVMGLVTGLGAWIPVGYCATVLGAIVAFKLIGLGIHFARIAASFLTFGGGST